LIEMPNELKLRTLTREDVPVWNAYVRDASNGTIFHRAEWKDIFEGPLRHRTHYLLAESGNEIRGILPLVHIHSRLFSHVLSSLPFLAYGGCLASDDDAAGLLHAEARVIANRLGVDYLELRNREEQPGDWLTKSTYVTFRKSIEASIDECLKAIPRKQRAMVRKGIGNGLESRVEDHLDNFYSIFSESYRNLGTPVLSRDYFEAIKQGLGGDCEILTVFHDETAVASVMTYYFNDEVIPYYGGSRASARSLMANDFMYWELMRRGCESEKRVFDFGRSREGTGSYRFKKHWGFVPEPLHYQYAMVNQSEMPDLSPGNPKYRLAIKLWKRLPTPVTRILGPVLARGLPG
jgi:FemAB-related protein (PEP-CTERM system-associated)